LDTSATISALIGGWFSQVADAIASGRLQLVCSDELLIELDDVLSRPRIARFISPADAQSCHDLHSQAAVYVRSGAGPNICRDPSDDYLLALADASRADYLVTRDQDLLVLRRYRDTEIVYPARFLQLLESLEPEA
jgi:hypothetical protein